MKLPDTISLDFNIIDLVEIVDALEKQGQQIMQRSSKAGTIPHYRFLDIMRCIRKQLQDKYPEAWKELWTNADDYSPLRHKFQDDYFKIPIQPSTVKEIHHHHYHYNNNPRYVGSWTH